jgi:hypothetical protein
MVKYVNFAVLLAAFAVILILAGLRNSKPPAPPMSLAQLKCEARVYENDYWYLKANYLEFENRQNAAMQHKTRVDYCVATMKPTTAITVPDAVAPHAAYPHTCAGEALRARDAAQDLAHGQHFGASEKDLDRVYSNSLVGCKV